MSQHPQSDSLTARPQCGLSEREVSLPQIGVRNYWRVYLWVHLLVVVYSTLFTVLDTGYWPSGVLQSEQGTLADFTTSGLWLVAIGSLSLLYLSPLLIVLLFARSVTDTRYAAAGVTELLLWAMHCLALLPAVQ